MNVTRIGTISLTINEFNTLQSILLAAKWQAQDELNNLESHAGSEIEKEILIQQIEDIPVLIEKLNKAFLVNK